MQIGILQTGHAPDALIGRTGDYGDMFQRLLAGQGLTFRVWSVVDMEFPASVHDAEGWLLTGSRHGAYEDHPFIPPLEAFIRQAHAEGVPMVGVCFGHQIIAQALGGKVEKYHGGWSVGPTRYRLNGEEVRLNAWHQDQVVKVPEGAEVVGTSPFCENAALVYGDRAFTVQAHPEFDNAFLTDLIAARGRGLVPDRLLAEAEAELAAPVDSPVLARQIADFFKQHRL
ncbi:MAG: type 1 glutamine amidotransferase [Rhodobacteraceae bacterium]|jgi:GMP synthase-like glutamine amidotransferase|nr:type 1 glutamine amidotransferase [Paracoccaceae bacterium]